MTIQTASYYTRPPIKAEDIELGRPVLKHFERAVATAIQSLMANPFYPPSAMFPRAYVGTDVAKAEPPSTLLVSFPMVNLDEPAELRVDLAAVTDEVLELHCGKDGELVFDPSTRAAVTDIADMLDAQAQKLRAALSEEPAHG